MRSLPRSVWWIASATLVNRMGAMVFPFLILYFSRSLKLDLGLAATIAAFYGVGSAVAAPLGGWLADRFDAVRVLLISMVLAGVSLVSFPWVRHPQALIVATFLIALLSDLARPASLTALARLAGPGQSRDAFALSYLAINLGMSVGPVVGGFLATYDYAYLFWIDGASSLGASLLLFASGARSPGIRNGGSKSWDWNIGRAAFRLVFWFIVILWVFITFFTATPVYLVEILHRPESWVGWVWMINTGLVALLSLYVNHRTRGLPLVVQLSWAACCFAFGYAVMGLAPGLVGLVICTLCLTVGEMMLFTNANAYLERAVPQEKLGKAMAFNSVSFSVALSCSTPTVGYFFTQGHPDRLWWILSLVGLIAAWGFYRLPRLPDRS